MVAKFERRTGLCEREETGTVIGKKLARAIISVVQIEKMDAKLTKCRPYSHCHIAYIQGSIGRGDTAPHETRFLPFQRSDGIVHAWTQRTSTRIFKAVVVIINFLYR